MHLEYYIRDTYDQSLLEFTNTESKEALLEIDFNRIDVMGEGVGRAVVVLDYETPQGRYGSCTHITRSSLQGRKYTLGLGHGSPYIHVTVHDTEYDHKTRKIINPLHD
jgi:hypothetical protein